MSRTKSERPEMSFSGTIVEGIDLVHAGIREDGLPMNQQDYKFMQTYLIGRDGILTNQLKTINDNISNAANRSTHKISLKTDRIKVQSLINELRSFINIKLSEMSQERIENSIEREARKGETTRNRFLRDYMFLNSFDQEFISNFLDDPDGFSEKEMQKEPETVETE
jgi:hypothetical protein